MRRLTASGVLLIAATYGLARFGLGLFVPDLRSELGLSSTAVGWVMGASFAGYVVALTVAGRLLAWIGPRVVAVAAGLCAAVGTLGIAMAPSPGLLGLAAAAGGLSTGWASTSLAAAVQAQLEPSRRPSAQTTINAGTSIGLIAAAAAAVLAGAAWRHAWLWFAAVALTATMAVAVTVDRGDRHLTAAPRGPVLHPIPPRLAVTALLLGASSATFWGFAREQLTAVASLPVGGGRSAWVALGAGGFAGALAGAAVRWFGLPPVLTVVWAGFAMGTAALASNALPLPVALLALAVIGAGYMSLTGLTIVWAVRDVPEQPGAAVATAFLVLAVGQTVASPVAGSIVEHGGLGRAFFSSALVAAVGVLIRPARTARDQVVG